MSNSSVGGKDMQRHACVLKVLGITISLSLLLAGCSGQNGSGETAEALTPTKDVVPIVNATGEVVPAQWTILSFPLGGEVAKLTVEIGDVVEAGDILAQLDTANLQAELAQAEAVLRQAKANLEKVKAGPTEQELEAAKQALAAANARAAAAVAQRDALYSSVTEADIANAEFQVNQAQLQYDTLQQTMQDLLGFADKYDLSTIKPGDPNPLAAGEMLAYQIELAEFELAAAQAYLDDLLDGPDPNQLRIENARTWLASAQASAVKARLDYLLAQPFPEDIAIAEANVAQAKAYVAIANAHLAQAELRAPFDGTVTAIFTDANEFVSPGRPIVQLADLARLRIETTDLNEIDVVRVGVGNQVIVTFDALPDAEVIGTVRCISPKVTSGTGVNFTVVVELSEIPEAIRWGMTAFVDIEVGS